MRLGVNAGRADLGCVSSFVHISTVATAPFDGFFALEHDVSLDICRQFFVAFFVLFFGDGDRLERGSDIFQAFFPGRVGEVFGYLLHQKLGASDGGAVGVNDVKNLH